MPRRLRIQYPDALYHVMSRGNARQDIVCDDDDRRRLTAHLERTVGRFGWRLYAFVVLSNHLHLVLKTPRPNLAQGCNPSSLPMPTPGRGGIDSRATSFRGAIAPRWSRTKPTSGS